MLAALIFNPGSNSLKFELIECEIGQKIASQANKLSSAALEGIGKQPKLSIYQGRKIISEESAQARDMREAVSASLAWLRQNNFLHDALQRLTFIGIRVVHGGPNYDGAAQITVKVKNDIEALEDLAPLHNRSSLDVLAALESELAGVPVFVTFDTAFHRTLPERSWRYPIERETADRHGIRKFGFHGVSHRYMLEQYAHTIGKEPEAINPRDLASGERVFCLRNRKRPIRRHHDGAYSAGRSDDGLPLWEHRSRNRSLSHAQGR
jgi:acetate kinase